MRKLIRYFIIGSLIAAISFSGYQLSKISGQYLKEEQVKDEMVKYQPAAVLTAPAAFAEADKSGDTMTIEKNMEKIVNQEIFDLQNEINSDIVGWLEILNTRISYPFVLTEDNSFYLRRDLHKKKATAGTLFMDYRCAKDFTSPNNIIYGHNMKNGSMFGDLKLFAESGFFKSNAFGSIFLNNKTYALKIFAYMVINEDDEIIYKTQAKQEEIVEYARKNARVFLEPEKFDRIVTLSTCSYEYSGARMVLLASLM
ncbi:MAG: class B sortase [Clostridiales bacterium]|nr:class B sortase [Clostridiales bacterium]